MHFDCLTEGTCSQMISFDLDGGRVHNIRFAGGCDGNLKAVSRLVNGWTVEEIQAKLGGITCGRRSTSCADQLAKAVCEALEEQKNA